MAGRTEVVAMGDVVVTLFPPRPPKHRWCVSFAGPIAYRTWLRPDLSSDEVKAFLANVLGVPTMSDGWPP
jgi:hypothetical protein